MITTKIILTITFATLLCAPSFAYAENICKWGDFEVIDLSSFGLSNDICDIATLGSSENQPTGTTEGLAKIIEIVILTLTAIVIMAALVSLVVGGYIYMTAGGSADRVQLAKTWITSAILGIVIALSSWIILGAINPGLI